VKRSTEMAIKLVKKEIIKHKKLGKYEKIIRIGKNIIWGSRSRTSLGNSIM